MLINVVLFDSSLSLPMQRLMHIVASSLYVLTGVTIGGGGTLISVYLDDLTILCKLQGVPKIPFKVLQTKWLTELASFSCVSKAYA
jgi:hypothetical protein